MKSKLGFAVICSVLGGCAGLEIVSEGKDAYIAEKDGSFTTFGGETVLAELFQEASDFCQKQGKHLQPDAGDSRDSGVMRYATAKLQFRCLAESNPEFTRHDIGKSISILRRVGDEKDASGMSMALGLMAGQIQQGAYRQADIYGARAAQINAIHADSDNRQQQINQQMQHRELIDAVKSLQQPQQPVIGPPCWGYSSC